MLAVFPCLDISSIAPLERHVFGFIDLQGGGLNIHGTATLTNTNVYSNQADSVRSPKCPCPFIHRPLELTLNLTGCCARARGFGVTVCACLHFELSATFPPSLVLTFAMCAVAVGELSCESNPCVTFHIAPIEHYARRFLACRVVASLSGPTEWRTLKVAISMITPLDMCA